MSNFRLGTRGSRLALAQAALVKTALEAAYPDLTVEPVIIRTSGDKGNRDTTGAFVREIQDAVLGGEIDAALHCLKDLPTEPVEGLRLSAYLKREDPRDTLISPGELAPGAVVGTGSVRRTSQLAAYRPDLAFRPLIGNVDTRLRKLMEGEYDAIVLALAGLKRLGVYETWSSSDYASLQVRVLESSEMLPSPGQGVLVLETREDMASSVSALNDADTERCSIAERTFLRSFYGGCSVPVAALGTVRDGSIHLEGLVASPDGTQVIRGEKMGDQPVELGLSLADELAILGASDIVRAIRGNA